MFKKKETTPKAVETMTRGEWMQKYWRPCAAFMYMACCLCDFAIFPIMFTVVQFWEEQAANDAFRQWVPITLQGGGLFHVSMCAVLGVSAYGRTQEKLAGQSAVPAGGSTNGGSTTTPTGGFATPSIPSSTPAPATNSWGSQPLGSGSGLGSTPSTSTSFGGGSGFGTPASAEVVTGFGGKPAPVIPPFPEK